MFTASKTKEKPSTPSTLGTLDYYTIVKKLLQNKPELEKKILPIIDFVSLASDRIIHLHQEFKKNSGRLYPETPLQRGENKIGQFFDHCSEFMAGLNQLIHPVPGIDVSKAMDNLMAKISVLSDEFELLNLETILNQYLPPHFDELKKKMLATVAGSMETSLLRIEKEASSTYDRIWQTVNEKDFQTLPRAAQYSLLISMEAALTLYKEFILTLDKLELQFGFRENSLLELLMHPEQEQKSEEQASHDKTTTEYTKMVLQQFQRLSSQYQKLIGLARYIPIETSPYRQSKNKERMRLKEKIISDLKAKQDAYGSLDKNIHGVVLRIVKSLSLKKYNYSPPSQINLPQVIDTAENASKFQQTLLTDYKALKNELSKKTNTLTEDDKEAILAPHKKALTLISELEFYLLEKARIETICQTPDAPVQTAPHRDFELMETLNMVIESTKMPNITPVSFDENRQPGNSLEQTLALQRTKVMGMINKMEDLFDPLFVKQAQDQFRQEKAGQKTPPNPAIQQAAIEPLREEKGQAEGASPASILPISPIVSQSSPDLAENEQKRVHSSTQNPLSNFAYKMYMACMRALDSIDILSDFIKPNAWNTPSETSPFAALTADMVRGRQIASYLNKSSGDYTEFEALMGNFASNMGSDSANGHVPEVKEMRPEIEEKSFPSTLKTILENKIKVALQPLQWHLSKLTELGKALVATQQAGIASDYAFTIGKTTVKANNAPGQLIQTLSQDIETISSAFLASSHDYLRPPTTGMHLKTVVQHARLLLRLKGNMDKFFDLITQNKIPAEIQLFYHFGQVFKKIVVLIDEYEIHLQLKEGTILKSIQEFLTYNEIDVNGYLDQIKALLDKRSLQFAQEDEFPFTRAIAANREKMRAEASDELTRAIIQARIDKSASDIAQAQQAPPDIGTFWSKKFFGLESAVQNNPLIQKFINKEKEHKKSDEFLDDIDALAVQELVPEDLFEGDIGRILKPLCNKKSILTELDRHIDRLIEQRYHWVWSRNKLEKRITLLQECRYFLRKQDHSLENASKQMGSSRWQAVLKTDRALFLKLDAIEKETPPDQRKKKTIALPKDHELTAQETQSISDIKKRIEALKQKYYISGTNRKKQELLTSLIRNMEAGKLSFKNALRQVKKEALEDCHLLHEGVTGKLIHDIEKSTAKPKHIKAHIDRKIQVLRETYFEKAGFFSKKSEKVSQTTEDICLLKQIRDPDSAPLKAEQKKRLKHIAPDVFRSQFVP